MRRAAVVFRLEMRHGLSRPLFAFLVALLLLVSLGFSTGSLRISSGDATVGGTKAWITSEFNFAFAMSFLTILLYSFFVAIGCGLAVVQDEDWKISEVLHATRLTPREYVWGKFLALLGVFLVALGLEVLFAIVCNHLLPNAEAAEIRGPFGLVNYLRPALVFAVPAIVFFAGIAFYLGERTRRPLLVFLFPLATLLVTGFFLWDWTPTWLDPRVNRALMLIDPSGFRWLSETWLKLDRGARFYNTARIGLDPGFAASRAGFLALGLAAVRLAERGLARRLRGAAGRRERAAAGAAATVAGMAASTAASTGLAATVPEIAGSPPAALAGLGMRSREPGLWAGCRPVARAELRNLFSSPGVYIFSVLILMQTLGGSLLELGAFQTELLLTPGVMAVRALGFLSVLLCLLLMFYAVESIERDRSTGLAAIAYATPTSTASLLLGKGLANGVLGATVVLATLAGDAIALLVQGVVPLTITPFLVVCGLLLLPTVLLWTAFVTAAQGLFQQRGLTYGLCLAALAFTAYRLAVQKMNWIGNWPLWGAVRWSDMGTLELDRPALVLSRLLALALAALLTAAAVRAFRRREPDAIGTLHRLQAAELARRGLRLAPLAVLPLALGAWLGLAVLHGFAGGEMKKKQKDYWKQNLATWKDAPSPAVAALDLDVTLEPERHWFRSRGSYQLWNDRGAALPSFAFTAGPHWDAVDWTLDGKPYRPENRAGLYVIAPAAPLAPGAQVTVGFDCRGYLPKGISRNGGGASEFILPSGVVLTSFRPSFTPLLGFSAEMGVDRDNRYEPRVYPPDFYQGKTDAAFGSNSPFTTRIRVTAPAAYTINSVGTLESDSVARGRRTVVWRSDHQVRFFNIVAGRWRVKRGAGTAIYYHPGHGYNVAAMSRALDAARRWYSRWFYPYPWRELKLSEFPALASYAQGFPSNISFSESIGFLTKSDVKTDAVFLVTAHESAHQWWGNLITPAKGPGDELLSEGMAHFSTLLLTEQVNGLAARIEAAKRIEESYGRDRHPDAERPLVAIDDAHAGDTTVNYDKGGWVFWMLLQRMGRERAMAGIHRFIADWKDGADHPALEDFIAAMRPFAPDGAAYDDFVRQWFHQVVVPEYQLLESRKRKLAAAEWEVTAQVKNAGTGRMPVELAAARGQRFATGGKPDPAYRDVRATVVLAAGEVRRVTLRCRFDPDSLVVDPDALVLQLRRKSAAAKL
jgi:ABC-2 type transport system permease protein